MNKRFGIFGLMVFMLISVECRAICSANNLAGAVNAFVEYPNANLLVRKNISTGTVLFSQRIQFPVNNSYMECTGSSTMRFLTRYRNDYANKPISSGIVSTPVPGIGIRTTSSWTISTSPKQQTFENLLSGNNVRTPWTSNTVSLSSTMQFRVATADVLFELIKTGDVTRGGSTQAGSSRIYELAALRDNINDINDTNAYYFLNDYGANILIPGCEVVGDANKTISFGTVNRLSNGTIPATDRYLTIGLTCTPGTTVGIMYDSTDKDSVYPNCVNNRGTAKNLCVLFQDGITSLGQVKTVISSAAANEQIRQRVSLFNKGGGVSAGTISAQATYTLNYE